MLGLTDEIIYRCVNEGTGFVKDEGVRIRVSFPSYKLVYEEGCEDVIWSNKCDMGEQAEKREQERRRRFVSHPMFICQHPGK